jgi:hypothetical protein
MLLLEQALENAKDSTAFEVFDHGGYDVASGDIIFTSNDQVVLHRSRIRVESSEGKQSEDSGAHI